MTTTDPRPTMPPAPTVEIASGAPNPRPAIERTPPKADSLGGSDIPRSQVRIAAHFARAAGEQTTGRHARHDAHAIVAAGSTSPVAFDPGVFGEIERELDPLRDARGRANRALLGDWDESSPAAGFPSRPEAGAPQGTKTIDRQGDHGNQACCAVDQRDVPDRAAIKDAAANVDSLLDPALALAADVLDDIERVRIANQNRVRQLTRVGIDADGEERGFGLDPEHPDVMRLGLIVYGLEQLEHDATLELQRKMRKHPLGAWVKAQKGVGDKQAARLLAAIGDPYINAAKGAPRTVSALWAYCGLHVLPGQRASDTQAAPAGDQHRDTDQGLNDAQLGSVGAAAKRRRGERANWSTKAKMRAYLVAESCMKTGKCPQCRDGHAPAVAQQRDAVAACACSPFRRTYDTRRAHTAITHPDWSDGHSHNDALRITAKEILKQLWRAARDWHLADGGAP